MLAPPFGVTPLALLKEVAEAPAGGAAKGFPVDVKKEFGDQKVEILRYATDFYLEHEDEWLAGAPDQVKQGSPQIKFPRDFPDLS